jgi:asparagine synthase (glutamine-hydrolysing)
MCGIAGILSLDGQARQFGTSIQRMTDRMRNRGPNDEGFCLIDKSGQIEQYLGDESVAIENPSFSLEHIRNSCEKSGILAFGHRRLSILDLSPQGHQPMSTKDRRYWIIYNGEIYNFLEVKSDLTKLGYEFFSSSDTEVILNAYSAWGEKCLQRFNGMFAFAIWDNLNKVLFCARDRIGIKPFYYTIQNNCFLFASDIKTLLASGMFKASPDPKGLYLAMAFGIAPRPLTAFQDVKALEQGHWLKLNISGYQEKQSYWNVPVDSLDFVHSENDIIEILDHKLRQSIKSQLISDVEVGSFMSGGVDSTTMTAIASQCQPNIKAFTLAYQDGACELDEVEQAKFVASKYKIEHIIHRVDPVSALNDLDMWIECYEEPYYGLSPTNIISKIAASYGIKVVINGLGGDELFAGYGWNRKLNTWKIARLLKPLIYPLSKLYPRYAPKIRALAEAESFDAYHTTLFARYMDSELQSLFKSNFIEKFSTTQCLHDLYVKNIEFRDPIQAFCYMDLKNYIGNHFVHRVDQMTMAHSIEGRFPFLDHELVELAFSIPSSMKVKEGVEKYILKKVAEKYIGHANIAMKKKGFALPVKLWMSDQLKPLVEQKLDLLKQRDFVNEYTVTTWNKEFSKGLRDYSQIWHLVALELWYEKFIDNSN